MKLKDNRATHGIAWMTLIIVMGIALNSATVNSSFNQSAREASARDERALSVLQKNREPLPESQLPFKKEGRNFRRDTFRLPATQKPSPL